MLKPVFITELGNEELLQIGAYFYKLIDSWNMNIAENIYIQRLLETLVRRLKKTDKFKAILDKYINSLVDNGELTPLLAKKNYQNPFKSTNRLEQNFEQDRDASLCFTSWRSCSVNEINLIRILYCEGQEALRNILIALFFTSKNYDDLSNDRIAEPVKLKNILEKYDDVNFVKNTIGLSEDEAKILEASFRYEVTPLLRRVTLCVGEDCSAVRAISDMSGIREDKTKLYLRNGEKLIDYGFLDVSGRMKSTFINTIREGNLDAYFTDVLRKTNVDDAFEIDSFNVSSKAKENLEFFLTGDDSANILLYGKPGSGKSEFAKALAKHFGMEAFVYKNETEVGGRDDRGTAQECNSLARLNCLLAMEKKNTLIIVDEAETVLKTIGFGKISLKQKGTVNQMLDKNNNKVIWILNYTNELDESTKRRMTYSIKFNGMNCESMQKIAKSELEKLSIKPAFKNKILSLFAKYKVTGQSVKNVLKTIKPAFSKPLTGAQEKKLLILVEDILESNSTLLYGKSKMRETVSGAYEESVINTSIPADKIVKMVQNAMEFDKQDKNSQSGIRMLFYGLSGTGKTEFARYIAQKLGKKIVLKRASDIFGMFVGETEKNIRDAFAEAEASDSILLFDEADSFFASRTNAEKSWERTQVNEFLTQMEEFHGICICTTNLKEIMDPAMNRRFHIITEFKPLLEEGVKTLLNNYFGRYDFTSDQLASIMSYESATPGDFGVLYSKVRFMDSADVSASSITDELCNIQKEKCSSVSGKNIGFCA